MTKPGQHVLLARGRVWSLAHITEVVKKLPSGKVPGVDEVHPEMLKAFDNVGLSCLTRPCSVAWKCGTAPAEWQTGVVVPISKKEDWMVCSNYRGITLLSLPGESLLQGAGKEALSDCRTSCSGTAVWLLLRSSLNIVSGRYALQHLTLILLKEYLSMNQSISIYLYSTLQQPKGGFTKELREKHKNNATSKSHKGCIIGRNKMSHNVM